MVFVCIRTGKKQNAEKLQNSFTKLGGVGSKTALRYAYSVINMDNEQAKEFAENIVLLLKDDKYNENISKQALTQINRYYSVSQFENCITTRFREFNN